MNRQQMKTKQEQQLSPQQLLLMRLLAVPAAALEQTIKEEIENNPLLEDEQCPTEEESFSSSSDGDDPDDELDFEEREINPFEESNFEDDDDYRYREQGEHDKNNETHELIASAETSFSDTLLEQFNLKPLTETERLIGHELIGSIDDSGYLSRDIGLITNDLAFTQNIDTTPQEVERVLRIIQTLDPAGVGARNLQECLQLQLERCEDDDIETVIAKRIVKRYFDDFSEKRYNKIQEALELTDEELESAIQRIKRLDPKPGSNYEESSATLGHFIMPDFIVSHDENGLSFSMNDNQMPKLKLSRHYGDLLHQMERLPNPTRGDKETIQFIRSKTESALDFIEMLNERHHTLEHTMEAILKRQKAYFISGNEEDLRPMKLQDIADDTGLALATISRVVTQKYVSTEFGTFLLKTLFSKGIANDEGEDLSTKAAKKLLSEIVEQEDKRSPLSDEAILKLLTEKGYPIARRTVAKYREQLGIPTSSKRKEHKR